MADTVQLRVRHDLRSCPDSHPTVTLTLPMRELAGQVLVFERVDKSLAYAYRDVGSGGWAWLEEWLGPVECQLRMEI